MRQSAQIPQGSGVVRPSLVGHNIGDTVKAIMKGRSSCSELFNTDSDSMLAGQTGVVTGVSEGYTQVYVPETGCFYVRWENHKEHRLKKIINNTNTIKTMSKQKSLFHTFDLGERKITLCVKNRGGHSVAVGYAVKVKDDKFNQELAEKISSGRADSKARLESDTISPTYQTTDVFKGIAKTWERRITFNPTKYIKGIRVE